LFDDNPIRDGLSGRIDQTPEMDRSLTANSHDIVCRWYCYPLPRTSDYLSLISCTILRRLECPVAESLADGPLDSIWQIHKGWLRRHVDVVAVNLRWRKD
jgi:hypothetical protein